MLRSRWLHAVVVAALLARAVLLTVNLWRGELGANPIEKLTHETGEMALRLLVATLAVTPLRRWLHWNAIAAYRRTLGLLAFGYALMHFSIWVALDHAFDLGAILDDVWRRPYVTAGFAAFLLLLPLAVTSTRGWIRRLGRRWAQLHRAVYAAAIAAIIHFLWLVKADHREPIVYGVIVAVLLLLRLPRRTPAVARVTSPPSA